MSEKEIWKDIEGFPNYQVSSHGRVRNKETKYIIAQLKSGSGYWNVRLRRNHGDMDKPSLSVHRLVAEAFLGGKHPDLQVNHKDGNKLNNNVNNLEWCTRKENSQHAMRLGLFKPVAPDPPYKRKVRIVETGEEFDSLSDCAVAIDGQVQNICKCLNGQKHTHKDLHFEDVLDNPKPKKQSFLYPHQRQAIDKMFTGCILNGGVGSGKSRTGIYYYFQKYGGKIDDDWSYTPMRQKPKPADLYIITTAKKRNDKEFEQELIPFRLSTDPKHNQLYGNKVEIDSWNNIKKYADIKDAFFIFDEDKITGKGAWAKAFLKIAKNNDYIVMSATSGDTWQDYETIFIANGFFKNRTEMAREHYIFARYAKFPKVDGYRGEGRLIRLRDKLLIDMDFERHTVPHHEDCYVNYDIQKYKDTIRKRWDPFKDQPIEQAAGLCYVLRRIVNEDESRQLALLELFEKHPRMIVFYNFDYERDIILNLAYGEDVTVAEYSGHAHDSIPDSERWIYAVQYTAGCEGFNCIKTDTIVFFSQNYSYKVMTQAAGRIDRLSTPFTDLYYYHLRSRSGIDLAISKALKQKKKFNETRWVKWDK